MTTPTPISSTTPDRLRQVIVETLIVDAQELQGVIGKLVVATSAEYPAAGPEDRSGHDAAASVTVLLADRIPVGQEAQALAEEIVRWHGRQAAQVLLGDCIEQENVAHFVDGDLLLARHGLNPQIRFAIGKIEGNDKDTGKVQMRLLHVLRAWGNEGHGRPDERFVQAIHTGLGNYAEFKRGDVVKLSNEDFGIALNMTASEVAAKLFAKREMSSSIEQASTGLTTGGAQSNERAIAQWKDYLDRKVPCVIYPGSMEAQGKFIVAPAEKPGWWLGDYGSLDSAKKFCSRNGLTYDVHETKPRACIGKPADDSPSSGL